MKIETVEQLANLPARTVVLLGDGTAAQRDYRDDRWYVAEDIGAGFSDEQMTFYLPARVIHLPTKEGS